MSAKSAYLGCDIFDGHTIHKGMAVLVEGEQVRDLVDEQKIPADFEAIPLPQGLLVPGFVDLQVNGGGGILLNQQPDLGAIETICQAHRAFGTTSLLPTLITDAPEVMKRAVEAGIEAAAKAVPGFLGLHLEGPHLSTAKKGAHSADLIRPMTDRDVTLLCEAKMQLPNLLVTLAPETVSDDHIAALSGAGIVVSLGHTQTTSRRAKEAFEAGARCATHLYNAMSGLTHREPGLVGAVLNTPNIFAGLIADGHHIAVDALNVALRAKHESTRFFLVTDAMSATGTDATEFELNGRRVLRRNGRLTLEDGTLAGADLDMMSAIHFLCENIEQPFQEILRMAALYPAMCLGQEGRVGVLSSGSRADMVHLDTDKSITDVWVAGNRG